ncbi:MAG: transglutaminase-like cysteine peptidase [Alphaproteobacteria bacterium]
MFKDGLIAGLLAALLAGSPATGMASDFPPLFDTIDYRDESLAALPQWQRVLQDIDRERSFYQDCAHAREPCEPRALLAWQAMIRGQSGQKPVAQLRAVNRFINRWQSRTDQDNYDVIDYWASPLTFLQRSGDCEDYAIIKYVSLRQLGFEPEQLRLVVVRDMLRDVAHAVLAVHVDHEVYILDNLFQAVLPQHMISQYLPYYSVNENARFSHLPADSLLLASSPWDVLPSMAPPLDADHF